MSNLIESVAEVLDGLKPPFEHPSVVWRDGYAVVYDDVREIVRPTPEPTQRRSWLNAPNYMEPHPEDVALGLCPHTGRKVPSCVTNWGCQDAEHKAERAAMLAEWRRKRRASDSSYYVRSA